MSHYQLRCQRHEPIADNAIVFCSSRKNGTSTKQLNNLNFMILLLFSPQKVC